MENVDLKEGMKAPEFSLMGSDNKEHNLKQYSGKKVILYFYPKDNTKGWTDEAIAFRDHMKDLNNHNSVVLGISRDSISSHEKFAAKHDLPFILLSDIDSVVCNLYGVLKEKNMYGRKSIGIERSTFIIDENGNIEKIYRKVKVNGHVQEMLKYLESEK